MHYHRHVKPCIIMRAHAEVHSDFKVQCTIGARMIKRRERDERDIGRKKSLYMEMEVSCIPNYCRYRGICHSAVYKCSRGGREKLHLIPISRPGSKPVLKPRGILSKETLLLLLPLRLLSQHVRDIVGNN